MSESLLKSIMGYYLIFLESKNLDQVQLDYFIMSKAKSCYFWFFFSFWTTFNNFQTWRHTGAKRILPLWGDLKWFLFCMTLKEHFYHSTQTALFKAYLTLFQPPFVLIILTLKKNGHSRLILSVKYWCDIHKRMFFGSYVIGNERSSKSN